MGEFGEIEKSKQQKKVSKKAHYVYDEAFQ
jgi:hypothetical protein